MDNIKVYKDDDPEVKTESIVTLKLPLFHPNETDSPTAKRIVRDAMIEFCEAAGLDIYQRNEQGEIVSVLEDMIVPAIEQHFRQQFVTVVTAHRQEKAARQQAEETQLALLGEVYKTRHQRMREQQQVDAT